MHGRIPLVKATVKRLLNKNHVSHVICVGSEPEERRACHESGAEFVKHDNKPLGKKWNYGFRAAKSYNPDFVVYVGSSDWLSDNWLPVMIPFAEEHGLAGKLDFNLLHISSSSYEVAWWRGYRAGSGRENEPIGIGRVISSKLLDTIGWKPFDDDAADGMDRAMWYKISGKTMPLIFNHPEIQSLSISCELWSNMHTEDISSASPYREPWWWLDMWFPEATKLISELQ